MGINLFLNTFQFDVTKIYFKILTQCTNSRFDILYDKTLYLEIEKHVLQLLFIKHDIFPFKIPKCIKCILFVLFHDIYPIRGT